MTKQQQDNDKTKPAGANATAQPNLVGSMGVTLSKEEMEEIAKKVPMATDAMKQAINTACAVLQGKKDGCTIRELREKAKKAKVSAHDLTDAVAGLMLAGKATYTGDRSRTVIMVNKKLEDFIIDSLKNPDCTFDKLQKEAEREGYSLHEFRDALERQSVIIDEHGKIKRKDPYQPPPAKAWDTQRAPRGSEGERYYEEASTATYQFENEFVKDHERVLYSSAFRRLAGVTQVFGTSQGHVFHNRLTHSIKAGQIARSIADRLKKERPDIQFHPDVVEAAALAHDLGHPPFGHTGELELDSLLTKHGVHDGYEGNAQNLRIVT